MVRRWPAPTRDALGRDRPLSAAGADGYGRPQPFPEVVRRPGRVFVFAACWSAKGGSGTTVVAAALAVLLARSSDAGALLVDLAGDAAGGARRARTRRAGLADWFAAGADVPADGLARLEIPVTDGLALLPRGSRRARARPTAAEGAGRHTSPPRRDRWSSTAGCPSGPTPRAGPAGRASVMAASAAQSLLVTRACYLSLRRRGRGPRSGRPAWCWSPRTAGRSGAATSRTWWAPRGGRGAGRARGGPGGRRRAAGRPAAAWARAGAGAGGVSGRAVRLPAPAGARRPLDDLAGRVHARWWPTRAGRSSG